MSSEETQKLNADKKDDTKNANTKKDKKDEEEDDGYTCGKCWNGYCACNVWICKVFIFFI